jgi:hypothetical protein
MNVCLPRRLLAALGLALLPAGALAQGFNNDWVTYALDQSRISASPSLGVVDTEEKDYAWGDLDQDGWTDLVSVRKQPFSTPGKRANVLYMNENGVLTDRTALYATMSDVPGDQGFLTPTNDRDVALADVDQDGWLDIVTATTYGSSSEPKSLTHPRVYINRGKDGQGNWLGFRYESGRIPTLGSAGPNFCAVAAGDMTGDGYPDLFFSGYSGWNDVLLINNGSGFFANESTLRMTSQMLSSSFGTSAVVVDLNLDAAADVVKDSALGGNGVSAIYNNPSNVGYFNIYDNFHGGFAAYHVTTGDLNNDGRPDVVVSDDGSDRYRYNLGTDPLGRVTWGPAKTFQFVTGGDDGFGSNNLVADLDGDGWNDVLICDVDVDISGCNRRMHIYHNPGGAVGSQPTLIEEAGSSPAWRGVAGMLSSDLTGVHDVAVFDLDNDGDMDMIVGRCSGTFAWINQGGCDGSPQTYCTAKVNSQGCSPSIGSQGAPSASQGSGFTVSTTNLLDNKFGLYFYSKTGAGSAPFQGGTLCAQAPLVRTATSNSGGSPPCGGMLSMDFNAHIASGADPALVGGQQVWIQTWSRDPGFAPPNNTSLSDALSFTICP